MKLNVHDIANLFDAPTPEALAELLIEYGASGIGGDPRNNAMAVLASELHGEPVTVGKRIIFQKRTSVVRVREGIAYTYGKQVANLPDAACKLFEQMAEGLWPQLEDEYDDA